MRLDCTASSKTWTPDGCVPVGVTSNGSATMDVQFAEDGCQSLWIPDDSLLDAFERTFDAQLNALHESLLDGAENDATCLSSPAQEEQQSATDCHFGTMQQSESDGQKEDAGLFVESPSRASTQPNNAESQRNENENGNGNLDSCESCSQITPPFLDDVTVIFRRRRLDDDEPCFENGLVQTAELPICHPADCSTTTINTTYDVRTELTASECNDDNNNLNNCGDAFTELPTVPNIAESNVTTEETAIRRRDKTAGRARVRFRDSAIETTFYYDDPELTDCPLVRSASRVSTSRDNPFVPDGELSREVAQLISHMQVVRAQNARIRVLFVEEPSSDSESECDLLAESACETASETPLPLATADAVHANATPLLSNPEPSCQLTETPASVPTGCHGNGNGSSNRSRRRPPNQSKQCCVTM